MAVSIISSPYVVFKPLPSSENLLLEEESSPRPLQGEESFDVYNAACALYGCQSNFNFLWSCCFFPICYARVKSQEIVLEERKLHLKFDNYCERVDSFISLERIQDIDVTQNCCDKCFNVKSISIYTAGGTPILIHGLKDTEGFRKEVVFRRDRLVHDGGVIPGDGTSGLFVEPNISNIPMSATMELREMKECLLRMEKLAVESIKR